MSTKELVIRLHEEGASRKEIHSKTGLSKGYIYIILRDTGHIPFPKSRLSDNVRSEAVRLYGEGLSMREAAALLDISPYDVEVALAGKLRSQGDSNHIRSVRLSPEIDETQKQILLGCLLGDGSITKGENRGYYVQITHSEKQRGYSEHIASKLGTNVLAYRNHGFSKGMMHKVVYKNAAVSKMLEATVLKDGKKRVNPLWLDSVTEEGLAYWFMDDGSASSHDYNVQVNFATNGFSKDECELLRSMLGRFGFRTVLQSIKNRREQYVIRLSTKDSEAFLKTVRPYVWEIECMRYKIKCRKIPRKKA